MKLCPMRIFAILACLALAGCYQMREGDDVRGVPITNNPTVVPRHGNMGQFTAMQP